MNLLGRKEDKSQLGVCCSAELRQSAKEKARRKWAKIYRNELKRLVSKARVSNSASGGVMQLKASAQLLRLQFVVPWWACFLRLSLNVSCTERKVLLLAYFSPIHPQMNPPPTRAT